MTIYQAVEYSVDMKNTETPTKWTRVTKSIADIPDTTYYLIRDGEQVARAFRGGSRLETARWRWYATNGSNGTTATLDSAKAEAEKATA